MNRATQKLRAEYLGARATMVHKLGKIPRMDKKKERVPIKDFTVYSGPANVIQPIIDQMKTLLPEKPTQEYKHTFKYYNKLLFLCCI